MNSDTFSINYKGSLQGLFCFVYFLMNMLTQIYGLLIISIGVLFSNSYSSCIAPIDNREIYRNTYTYPETIQGEHFVVHFTTSDVDSQFVNGQWFNLQCNTGYAQSILDHAESALSKFLQDGWENLPPDCDESITDLDSPDHCINFGGNSLYDIYISNDAAGMVQEGVLSKSSIKFMGVIWLRGDPREILKGSSILFSGKMEEGHNSAANSRCSIER